MKAKIQGLNLIFGLNSTCQTRIRMDYIEIKGYKSIRHAMVEIKPINILIGGNGAGKSNFISFFEFLEKLYSQRLQNHVALNGGMDKMLFQGRKVTDELKGHISFADGTNEYSFTLVPGAGAFVVTREGLWFERRESYRLTNGPEAMIKKDGAYRAKYIREHLASFRINHFHDTGKTSPFTKESHIENDIYFLYAAGDNIAAYLYHIQEKRPKTFTRIIRVIQSIAPFFLEFHLVPNENKFIRLQWRDKYSDFIYGVNDLSDGTMRFIALAVLFLQPNLPNTLIIDEPELGLHPFAIEKLAGMIKSAASKGCQVIVSTQSTDLVTCFDAEDIITVNQVEGDSKFKRLKNEDLADWMDDYALGDLWKRNIISGGQP